MLISILALYNFLKSYWLPLNNERKGTSFTDLSEIQQIFFECSRENEDEIRSSILIEAITIKYGLNEELKSSLINHIDPDNIDLLFTKDDLFTIFKDWIGFTGFVSDVPATFSYKSFVPSCSVSTPVIRTKRLMTRSKLFLNDDSNCLGSDEPDTDMSHKSSSTKKKLTYCRSILESRLHNSEMHADSLEKKFESVNVLCEKQKLEIERLKQELQIHREMVQSMEEISELKKKDELRMESKYMKAQTDLTSALSKIEFLESMEINLRQDYVVAQENARKWEADLMIAQGRIDFLESDISKKTEAIKEMEHKISYLNVLNENNNVALTILSDEKMSLNNKLNDMHNDLMNISQACETGVPLCEELPSEMLQFPFLDHSDNEEPPAAMSQVNDQEVQTMNVENERLYTSQEVQTDNLDVFRIRLYSCQGTQTSHLATCDKSSQMSTECKTTFSQTIERLHSCQNTQTEDSEINKKIKCTSREVQTLQNETKEKSLLVSSKCRAACTQTIEKLFVSQMAQTGFNDFKMKGRHCFRCLKFIGGTAVTLLTVLILLFAIFFMTFHYCQKNQCLQLRYPNGPPPV